MNIKDLKLKWSNVSAVNNKDGFKALRITAKCISDLFIGVHKNGYRCLILFIPLNVEVKLNGVDKEKLRLEYIKSKNVILIRLNDPDFQDLFNDLVLSLYLKIKDISNAKEYANQLIQGFYKWAEFFEDKHTHKLSREEVMGFFGELFMLNEYIAESTPSNINDVLSSWKGPFDTTHDFIFDNKDIEIKTKEIAKHVVKISSEHQLENEFDKRLELLVVSVRIDLVDGKSIHDLLLLIIGNVRKNQGELSILYNAISQKGFTVENSKEYNNHRFIVSKMELYNCMANGFPKLSVCNIPVQITKLDYLLRVNSLDEFLIEEKKY
ncbi:MAG: PD-(D/E)XK motif protein [Labilibaculum sp.]|nr:PD-(D/E)XK motif protein [Labilibaculum sp.]